MYLCWTAALLSRPVSPRVRKCWRVLAVVLVCSSLVAGLASWAPHRSMLSRAANGHRLWCDVDISCTGCCYQRLSAARPQLAADKQTLADRLLVDFVNTQLTDESREEQQILGYQQRRQLTVTTQ